MAKTKIIKEKHAKWLYRIIVCNECIFYPIHYLFKALDDTFWFGKYLTNCI